MLALPKAVLAQLFEQLVEAVAQRLLVLLQGARALLLALLTLLTLLTAALPVLLLAAPVGAVAQVLLLADHVAQLIERRRHLIVVAAAVGRGHLQIFHHLLELGQKLLGGVARAAARHVLQPVEHVLQIALGHDARIGIERTRRLTVIALLLRQRLHVAVHRLAQLVHQLLDFLIAGAVRQRLAQRLLGVAQRGLRIGHVAVLDVDRHRPQPLGDVAQCIVIVGMHERPVDRAQSQIGAGVGREFVRRERQRVERREHDRL